MADQPHTTLRPFPTCPTKQACYAVQQCQNVCGVVHGARELPDDFVVPPADQAQTTKWITVTGPGGEPIEIPDPITVFRSPLAVLERRIKTLFSAIAHGSDEHRAWLKKAIDDHFNGKPVEPPGA